MAYDPKNAKEKKGIPEDTVLTGIITNITDGKVSDFVKNTEKWEGDTNNPAIEITILVQYEGQEKEFKQVLTYQLENDTVIYPTKSNMGKYKKIYGKLPEEKDEIKCITDGNGFLKIKIE